MHGVARCFTDEEVRWNGRMAGLNERTNVFMYRKFVHYTLSKLEYMFYIIF